MKVDLKEEIEISDHLAEWLYSVHEMHYLAPINVPDEAFALGLVEQMGPDTELTEKGRRVAKDLHKRAKSLVKLLKSEGVEAGPHALGVFLTHDEVYALVKRLRSGES